MGNSAKWFKSLIPLKKPQQKDHEKVGEKSVKKWRLWRTSSEGCVSSTKGSVKKGQAEATDDAFSAAMATVVRAPPKDFMAIKQEWAAIRIQTAFRAFLARRALRALRAVVRIQAIFRGRQVRKQAAVTLRCMQALVRVQARVRARGVGISPEGHNYQSDPVKAAEGGWCDGRGTIEEVKAKLQMRQEGAIKRERAIAYSLSQQQLRMSASPKPRTKKPVTAVKTQRLDRSSPGRSWLDRWMATKPWENRLMEEINSDTATKTPLSRKSEDNIVGFYSYSPEDEPVKVRRNNVTTKISARPPTVNQMTQSSSDPSTESLYDETPASTSSTSSSSQTPKTVRVDGVEDARIQKRSYMNLTEATKAKMNPTEATKAKMNPTEATKAKQRGCKSENMQKHFKEDMSFHSKSGALSVGDARSNVDSDSFVDQCKDLYPPEPFGRQRWPRISRRTRY